MRRKAIPLIIAVIALLALASGCCHPPGIASVGLSLHPQERDWWCWAASTEMISEYYGHRIAQCDSANYVHGTPPDCCTGCTGICPCWGSGWGATISDIQNNWTHWNFEYKYVASSLPWEDADKDDVKDTISPTKYCKKSPIYVVWWWTGGGGHVVVAYGYAEAGGQRWVSYMNPWPPDCERPDPPGNVCNPVGGGEDVVSTYDAFVNDGVHQWGNSFYAFKYIGS
ncbi:MAG: hypothetical protein IBX72_05310 [Nitrospirae bacterium]|nr:hypothetical protein [Nitrospirota bacterium]